jgi:hypothetical protein
MAYYGNNEYNYSQRGGYGLGGASQALQDPLSSRVGLTGYSRPVDPRGQYGHGDSGYNYLAGYNGNPHTTTHSPYNGGFSGYYNYPTRVHQGALGYGYGHSGWENSAFHARSNIYSPEGSYYGWGRQGLDTGFWTGPNTRRTRLASELGQTNGRQFNLRDSLLRLQADNQVDHYMRRY